MLGGDQQLPDLHRPPGDVADRHLGRTVRTQIRDDLGLADVSQAFGKLVRMALGDGLGGEQVLVVGKRGHEISRNSSAVESASPLVESRPTARIFSRSPRRARYCALRVNPVCSPRLRSWLKSRKSSEV